jgi:DNA ligase-1
MHGIDYSSQNIEGYMASEKLEGCRAYWDGSEMWTRGGKIIRIPDTMRRGLRARTGLSFDGEIHAGRGNYEIARLAVQYGRFTQTCEFSIFDAPVLHGPFESRYLYLKSSFSLHGPVNYVEHVRCYSLEDAVRMMLYVQTRGGEGVMLRDPFGIYAPGRTEQMLKLKKVPQLFWSKAA